VKKFIMATVLKRRFYENAWVEWEDVGSSVGFGAGDMGEYGVANS